MQRLFDYIHYLFSSDKEFRRKLRRILGFYPREISVYREALMHRSLNHYRQGEQKKDNERLEYLGDAIIEAVVSDILYHQFPGKKEGFLTSVRSKIVQRSSLNRIAKEIGLPELIQSTHINHTHNSFIPGNAFEALVGAIYLDQGYLPPDLSPIDHHRWLYTAFTRATEQVYLVNFPLGDKGR